MRKIKTSCVKGISGLTISILFLCTACGQQQSNPYVTPKSNSLDNAPATNGSSPNNGDATAGGTTASGTTANGITTTNGSGNAASLSLAQTWDAACASLTAAQLSVDMSQEIAVLCNGGTATDSMKNYANNAYAGQGTPASSTPVILDSVKNPGTTELMIGGAIKVSLTMAQMEAKYTKTLTLSTDASGVNITNALQSAAPTSGPSGQKCYNIQQTIKTVVAMFTFNDLQDQKECTMSLTASSPLVDVSYRTLVAGDPVNTQNNNKLTRALNLTIQTDANTVYAFSVQHMTINNQGMPNIAEPKIEAQPPALIQAYYSALTAP